jgi:hypothetical protein
MNILSRTKLIAQFAKLSNKWIVYLSWGGYYLSDRFDYQELLKAAPYLNTDLMQDEQAKEEIESAIIWSTDNNAILTCETEEEAFYYFDRTVGDDGPTKFNNYQGRANIYAEIIDNNGNSITVNT